jgi:prolipoprotein diacylglyceryltransferase
MHPWLLQNPSISAYGACIVGGIVLAWLLARRQARRAGLDASHVDLLVPLLVAAGLAGAWIFGGLTDAVVDASAHGTVLLGSLLVATAAGIVFALIARIPLGILGDIAAAPVALGISCGRVGCFFCGLLLWPAMHRGFFSRFCPLPSRLLRLACAGCTAPFSAAGRVVARVSSATL